MAIKCEIYDKENEVKRTLKQQIKSEHKFLFEFYSKK